MSFDRSPVRDLHALRYTQLLLFTIRYNSLLIDRVATMEYRALTNVAVRIVQFAPLVDEVD